ncbi:uncharacterized protein LODBEIA_P04310 [Lodderomyces beijingensis]|uniref:Cap-associated protein CAF20 n=1 Tax=Lodderomyces beijingensis TaxID=1775926 RepID=A0ABP0ZDG7_9ASCO
MVKYTEEQLLTIKDEQTYVPQPQILAAFNEMIEQVKEHAIQQQQQQAPPQSSSQQQQKWRSGDTYIDERGNERSYQHMNRRRGSRSGNGEKKPFVKKSKEVVKDEDGWETTLTNTTAAHRGSVGEDGIDERNMFGDAVGGGSGAGEKGSGSGSGSGVGVRARPNNKNLGSSKAVDPREIVSDKQTRSFNAFAALEGDDDDDEEEEE